MELCEGNVGYIEGLLEILEGMLEGRGGFKEEEGIRDKCVN